MSTNEPEVSPLADVDQEKLDALKQKLAKYLNKQEGETPAEGAPEQPTQEETPVVNGKDVDWSKYDLQFNLKHLYPVATVRPVDGVPKWVVMITEFFSTELDFRNHGKQTQKGEHLNLGEYLSNKMNDPDGWSPVSMLPTGGGRVGILLSRQQPLVLPDPELLSVGEDTPAPTDGELAEAEDAALAFMAAEGLTPPPVVGDNDLGDSTGSEG